MDLDELKQAWSTLKVERVLEDVRKPRIAWLGIAAWIVFVVAAGSFWFDHRDNLHLLVAGVVLHLYGIAALASGLWLLVARMRLDYTAPIVTLQRELASLHRCTAARSLALGLPWWILWLPCVLVAAGAIGVDLYAAAPAWVWSSIGVGIAGIVISVLLARYFRGRPMSPAMERVIDSWSGDALSRATHELEEVARFAD